LVREYKTVRLSNEAKVWIDQLINRREHLLQSELKDGLVTRLEDDLFKRHLDKLNGVSFNVVLKVSNGSVIEEAYRNTKDLSDVKWLEKLRELESLSRTRKVENSSSTVTPRLYMDTNVMEGLEEYRKRFMTLDPERIGKRPLKLSFVIKLVVYAYLTEVTNTI
ncbi:hypothetical protein, partial [Bacillus atrophaeus]|uniref:hypothetical protein n=1 Tax=Bacillus atrophaeus TaxID=1452 RepID=UPI00227FC03B